MEISAKAKFLVRNIEMGNVTYQEVLGSKAVIEEPELAEQIDAYIAQQELEIDKTV